MNKILIVGAGGYVGSRLFQHLQQTWPAKDLATLDLNIYGMNEELGVETGDIVKNMKLAKGSTVIYLPSFHRAPEHATQDTLYAYRELMKHIPCQLASIADRFIYVSSMRAITDRNLYGRIKLEAERVLICHRNTHIIRPGTLWGGLSSTLPNRLTTALNFALYHEKFKGLSWQGFTTYLPEFLAFVGKVILEPELPSVLQVLDQPLPLAAHEVRELLAGKNHWKQLQMRFTKELLDTPRGDILVGDERALENLKVYYALD